MQDLYTIKSLQTKPHKNLHSVVLKHASATYQKPISNEQQDIFLKLHEWVSAQAKPIILDLGCGTGTSTAILARQHPEHLVIGIDKSSARLSRAQTEEINHLHFVQANLIDFWRLAVEHEWQVEKQYILYPNPYPKPNDLNSRWHGHPVFSELLKLSPEIEVRSNWRIYLEEFIQAAKVLRQVWGQINLMNSLGEPLTAFEKKYWTNDVKTYRLILQRDS